MDETALRRLAEQLLTELPARIPDAAERAPVAGAIGDALATPEGQGRDALRAALSARPATRAWMREHGATEDVFRGGLLGEPTTPLGFYYVCPREDADAILLTRPVQPPLCPVHGLPMSLQG
jgi:hypothetical protein